MNKQLFLTGEEMFPQFADTDNNLRYFDFIAVDELKDFIRDCYTHANLNIDEANLDYENMVCKVLIDHLIRRGLLDVNSHQNFIDVLLTAIFLHNIYFDEKDLILSLIAPRQNFDAIAEKYIPEQISEAIFDAIESQLGDATPIKKFKPSPNSPQELLAECIFITRSLYRWR